MRSELRLEWEWELELDLLPALGWGSGFALHGKERASTQVY